MASKARKERRRIEFMLAYVPREIGKLLACQLNPEASRREYCQTVRHLGHHLTAEEFRQVLVVKRKLAGLDNPYEDRLAAWRYDTYVRNEQFYRSSPERALGYSILELKSLGHSPTNL